MCYQDRDLKKLKKFIKQLGLKLYVKKYTRYTGLAEYVTNSHITLFDKKTTKKEQILSLLHEIGHHLDWLKTKETEEDSIALDFLANGPMIGNREDIPKKYRKIILQIERNGVKYMSKIHNLLQLEIPLEVVKLQQELDLYDYDCLYKRGSFASIKEYERFEKCQKKKLKNITIFQ